MRKLFLLLSLLIINYSNIYSQPQFEWVRNYPMYGKATAMDSTGNIYVIGTIGTAIKILKYNVSGNLIWHQIDSLNTDGSGICAASDKAGNIYFTAEVYHILTDKEYTWVIATVKYDSAGNKKWVKQYTTGFASGANAMAIDYAGNICIAGYGSLTYRYNYLTIKYNPQGDTLWTAIYNSPSTNGGSSANAICVDLQNNVYVTGNSIISTRPIGDYLTIKYNNNGIQQWEERYEGPNQLGGEGESIIVDKYGYCYVTGTTSHDSNRYVIGTIKYATNGDSIWTRLYFPPFIHGFEYGNNILLDTALNVYVTGLGGDLNNYRANRIIKYDKYGNLLWTTLDSEYIFDPYSSILDKYGNIYLTGSTTYTIYSTEYNSSGIKIWSSHYPQFNPTNICYSGFKFLLDNYNNLYLFGSTLDSSILLKYGLITNIYQSSENVSTFYKLYQNYPNPFNPMTKIKFDIPDLGSPLGRGAGGMCVLKVYDILGKEIETLVNEKLNPGTYEVTFNASQYPSGVYFYSLYEDGKIIDAKRMIVLK